VRSAIDSVAGVCSVNLGALDTFVCPLSKERLSLVAFEEERVELDAEQQARARRMGLDPSALSLVVKEGVVCCEASQKWYPIINYVPVLLDYGTDLHRGFRERHAARTDIFQRYELPDGKPRQGEEFVQRSFTKEWNALNFDDVSFGFKPEDRDKFTRLELDWPTGLLDRDRLKVLEVGCGSGFESLSLERVTGGEIIGIDLNHTIIRNGAHLARNPFVNVAVASAFAVPARPQSFDIVYSSGVLHHTYSTKAAFDEIARYRHPDGFIYIWVYAYEDWARSIYMRMEWSLEEIVRPRLARAPDAVQNAFVNLLARYVHWWYRRKGPLNRELWTRRSAEHSVRDRWTALYANRHSFHEIITWFIDEGLDYRLVDPRAYADCFGAPLIGIGIRGVAARR
jgi:ubiquinone/menaquinone biosynthesis C-methylase UbiE/uncharacterized protein YbaR (Trm112 family)